MKKVITYIFLILLISELSYAQNYDHFGKITLKLNNKYSHENLSASVADKPVFFKKKLSLADISLNDFQNNTSSKNRLNKKITLRLNDKELNPMRPVWVPITEVVGLNLALGAFNAYVAKSGYAKISFKTIQKNFQTGAVWDTDHFLTNFFAHPYHGSIYFNAARSTGYNFWESTPFAFGGSLMWELFMENEPPSTNDLINTTVSGIFLGETLYRLSSLIINERKRGFPRVVSEVLAGLLNPARGFNRLIYGDVWRVTDKKVYETQPLAIGLNYGVNHVSDGTDFYGGYSFGVIDLDMVYGNPFEEIKRKPFDFFRIRSTFNFGAGEPPIGAITAYGILWGKNIKEKKQDILAGIFQHYDFFDNNTYKVGGVSFGAGLLSLFQNKKEKGNRITTSLHLNLMPLGASNSAYSAFGEKEYNFTIGANMQFESFLELKWGYALIDYKLYFMHTIVGASSNEYVGILKPKIQVNVYKNISVGAEYIFYHREGYYQDYPDIHTRNNEQKLFVNYTFENIDALLRK